MGHNEGWVRPVITNGGVFDDGVGPIITVMVFHPDYPGQMFPYDIYPSKGTPNLLPLKGNRKQRRRERKKS